MTINASFPITDTQYPGEEVVDTGSKSILPVSIIAAFVVVLSVPFVFYCVIVRFYRKNKQMKRIENNDDDDDETDSVSIGKVRSKGTSRQRTRLS